MECWEPTFVAYFFKENKKYLPFCYPMDYEPEDPENDTVYGLIQNVDEARAYNLTFDPYFYSPDAAVRYRQSTYEDTEQDQGNDKDEHDESDENIRGIWESDDEDTTESTKPRNTWKQTVKKNHHNRKLKKSTALKNQDPNQDRRLSLIPASLLLPKHQKQVILVLPTKVQISPHQLNRIFLKCQKPTKKIHKQQPNEN